MTSVFIRVAGVPVAKGRPRIGRAGNGRAMAFTPAKTRKYEALIRFAAGEEMAGRAPLEGPLKIGVVAYLPIPKSFSKSRHLQATHNIIMPTKRPDLDNYLKAALDACNSIVWRDDSQVVEIEATKLYSKTPALHIFAEQLEEGSSA